MKKAFMTLVMLAAIGCGSQTFAQSVNSGKTHHATCVKQNCATADSSRKSNCCADKKVDGTTSSSANTHRNKGSRRNAGTASVKCCTSCSSCKSCGCDTGKCDTSKCSCAKCPAKAKRTAKK